MKKKDVFLISIFLIISCMFTVDVTYNALTGDSLLEEYKDRLFTAVRVRVKEETTLLRGDRCSSKRPIDFANDVKEPHLAKLKKYQEICGSYVTSYLMIFTDMPKDAYVARENAKKLAGPLKLFSQYGVTPIVIVEPVSDWGLVDFQEFGTGFYDNWIVTFFRELKKQGVEDRMMGMWVPFPEANLPYWNHANAQPADFAAIVNRYLRILKKEFPGAKGGILLNSATYETDDFEWANGEYVSLRQYVVGLDKTLIDSVGMQGFPWISVKGSAPSSVFDPSEFLNHNLIAEAADIVGVKEIWLNTGTFGAKYTLDPENTVYISAEKRKDLLDGILSQALELKNKGYKVTVNIFAEDKSEMPEATDWSYLPTSFSKDTLASTAFVEFAAKLEINGINLSLFDK